MKVTTYSPDEVQVLEPAVKRRGRSLQPAQGIRRGRSPQLAQGIQRGQVIQSRRGWGQCWRVIMINDRGLPYCRNLETGTERVLSRPENYVVVG